MYMYYCRMTSLVQCCIEGVSVLDDNTFVNHSYLKSFLTIWIQSRFLSSAAFVYLCSKVGCIANMDQDQATPKGAV